MSAATIDRRLAGERAKRQVKGRRATKPGSLLKSQIAVRTWADWDDARPGFVEVDLVSHDGGNAIGPFAFTLTVTDIATGSTENRSVPGRETTMRLEGLGRHRGKRANADPGGGLRQRNRVPSTSTCSSGAGNRRDHLCTNSGRRTRTTAATSSRRTGQSYEPWSATTATTLPQSCFYSTRFGNLNPN